MVLVYLVLEVLDGLWLLLLLLSLDLEVGLLPSSRGLCSVTPDTLKRVLWLLCSTVVVVVVVVVTMIDIDIDSLYMMSRAQPVM